MNLWVVQDQREPLLQSASILVLAAQPWVPLTVIIFLTMKLISADLDLLGDLDYDPYPGYCGDHDHDRFRIADDRSYHDYNVDLDRDCPDDDNLCYPCDLGDDLDDHDDLGNPDHANLVGDRVYHDHDHRDHDLGHDDHHVVHDRILCPNLGLAKVS